MAIIARLLQSLPLVIFLVILAVVVYFVVSWLRSPERAKEVLIRLFTVLNLVLSALFLLATLYAWFEWNVPVLELTVSFLVVSLVALAITRICRWRFVKNNPITKTRACTSRSCSRCASLTLSAMPLSSFAGAFDLVSPSSVTRRSRFGNSFLSSR